MWISTNARCAFGLLIAAAFLVACSSDDGPVPEECVGAYKLRIEKTTYIVLPGGGQAPDHCAPYAISLEEHLEKRPLPEGYVNCRLGDGRVVGMKPETCAAENGKAL